ncbi:MAG: tol-pal system protein YbgF [Salinisphaera sp.]|jgi:tol-pal system protein YbgF|nr:tol-pal system protein YbgF [Salinisphaera sp.]
MRQTLIRSTLALTVVTGLVGLAARPAMAGDSQSPQPYLVAQNNNGPNLFSLFQQIQTLQQQVRDLQGQVDTLQHKLKQSEQGQRDLYQNLDKRLSKLEGGDAGSQSNDDGSNANVAPDVQSAYMDGFNKLKNGHYDAAITSFKSFVSQHPETSLSDKAWYWLGEAYYVQQDLGNSRKAFETVVNRFANSPKVPASLYKIALIQAAQNQIDNAKSTLQRVISQYPSSDSAALARQKLQALGG